MKNDRINLTLLKGLLSFLREWSLNQRYKVVSLPTWSEETPLFWIMEDPQHEGLQLFNSVSAPIERHSWLEHQEAEFWHTVVNIDETCSKFVVYLDGEFIK